MVRDLMQFAERLHPVYLVYFRTYRHMFTWGVATGHCYLRSVCMVKMKAGGTLLHERKDISFHGVFVIASDQSRNTDLGMFDGIQDQCFETRRSQWLSVALTEIRWPDLGDEDTACWKVSESHGLWAYEFGILCCMKLHTKLPETVYNVSARWGPDVTLLTKSTLQTIVHRTCCLFWADQQLVRKDEVHKT